MSGGKYGLFIFFLEGAPKTTIYKGSILEVWEEIATVYLGFGTCIVILPVESSETLKTDFRKLSTGAPAQDDVANKCGRRF